MTRGSLTTGIELSAFASLREAGSGAEEMDAMAAKKQRQEDRSWRKQATPINDERRVLLAKIHIAIKDLGIDEDTYRELLRNRFNVESAKVLGRMEMKKLLKHFESCGWQPKGGEGKRQAGKPAPQGDAERAAKQVMALRQRALDTAAKIENGDKRLQGLCRRICEVEHVDWCRDAASLKRLIAVLDSIVKSDASHKGAETPGGQVQ
jgi:phage gp16-like protein